MRVAVIGAGISGVACAHAAQSAGHEVVVLDRGRVPGGRMASRRFDGRYADLGASYFTVSDPAFEEVVQGWDARPWTDRFHVWEDGVLLEAKPGPVRWSAPGGLRSLVAQLAQGLDVRQQVHVERVSEGRVDGEPYDVVVLAMPDPMADAILSTSLREPAPAWDPALVLAAQWDERRWDWDGLFVHGSPSIAWVADDGSRRGDGAPVLTAHSTAAFAASRLAVPADAADELVAGLAELGVPAPAQVLRVQRWTFAKPVSSREELFSLSSKGIGRCGDGWGQSRVEGAWLSGTALGQALSS